MKILARGVIGLSNAYRRALALGVHVAGPRITYAYYRTMARWLYRLFDPLRERCEAQCRAALGERLTPEEIKHVAAESFVHRALDMGDLLLAERRIKASTYARYGGSIPEPYLGMLHDAQARRRAVILVTAYYGPFDLLPLFLGYNGIRACAVYKRHPNRSFDTYRARIRMRSGCAAVPVEEAISRLPEVLEEGGVVAILSDHHARHGVAVRFLGVPTTASRAVGLLAVKYGAVVAVAGIRRTDRPFRFEIVVSDFFDAQAWASAGDPVVCVTERYVGALERIVLQDPAQYLWAHARWGNEVAPADLPPRDG